MSARLETREIIWTQQVKEQLVELWDGGLPTAEIARRLGCSKNSVIGKAHRLFLKPRSSPIKRNYDLFGPPRQRIDKPAKTFPKPPDDPPAEKHAFVPAPPKPVFVAPKPLEPFTTRAAEPGERHCQWLDGDPSALTYCQNYVGRSEPWCADHRLLVYKKRRDKVAAF
jgi:GcrA cell cycle regulator